MGALHRRSDLRTPRRVLGFIDRLDCPIARPLSQSTFSPAELFFPSSPHQWRSQFGGPPAPAPAGQRQVARCIDFQRISHSARYAVLPATLLLLSRLCNKLSVMSCVMMLITTMCSAGLQQPASSPWQPTPARLMSRRAAHALHAKRWGVRITVFYSS